MATSLVLAAALTAASSSDITVGNTAVSVYAFSAAGGQLPSGVQLPLERKVATTGLWQPVYDDGAAVFLSHNQLDYVISGPGVYRVTRPAGLVSIGVETDDGA